MQKKVKKRKVGRPTKLTPKLAVKIFALARKGLTNEEIASIFDLEVKTIYNWQKNDEFLHALKSAKNECDSLIERSLFERAMGYTHPETKFFCHDGKVIPQDTTKVYAPDPVSCIFWLKNRQPDKWRDAKDMTLQGKDGEPLKIDVVFSENGVSTSD